MLKKRVFVSFHFDHDKVLKDFIIGQARLDDSPFEVVDCSLKEAAPEKTWEYRARRAIKGCDVVLVMVGPYTHRAPGVLKEVPSEKTGIPVSRRAPIANAAEKSIMIGTRNLPNGTANSR